MSAMKMEEYFLNQTEIYETVKKLYTNIKKDGSDRKTVDYCKRKLELLEAYWNDYQTNHQRICEIGVENHVYFNKECFETMKQLYLNVKEFITNIKEQLAALQLKPRLPEEDHQRNVSSNKTEPGTSLRTSCPLDLQSQTGNSPAEIGSRLGDMIKRQNINFKAFVRTINSIDVDQMQNKWEYEDALKSLQLRWSVIDSFHWEIEEENGGEDLSYQIQFSKYEKLFIELKKSINTKMWSMSHREKSTPQLPIPDFSGSYQHFISFKDLFTEAIHKNATLSNAQKMQFLKGKVTGEAARLIQHLQINSDNYEICWDILNHRFNNKRLIFTSHINALLGLPNMQQQSLNMIKKLHDLTKETLHSIKNLGVEVSSWDPLLVHLLSQKLDSESFAEYMEAVRNPRELPVLQEFLEFLEYKFTTLEASRRKQEHVNQKSTIQPPNLNNYNSNQRNHSNNFNPKYNKNYSIITKPNMKSMHVSRTLSCAICNADHGLWACSKFLQLSDEQKLKTINRLNYCVNCFICHFNKPCHSTKRCRKCLGLHNTLLHEALVNSKTNSKCMTNLPKDQAPTSTHVSVNEVSEILLATAVVKVTGRDGTLHTMRALIDQGSQISLISENAAQILSLKRKQCKGKIFGVGEKENNCKGMLNIQLRSIYNEFSLNTNVLIMNNLLKNLPNQSFTIPAWSHIQNINLADRDFYVSRPVDLLLGAEIYSKILLGGILRGDSEDHPIAQQTQLGWLLCGSMNPSYQCNVVLHDTDDLRRFWETQEISTQQNDEMSSEDQECLEYFLSTTKRLEDGRYEVRLPFKAEFKHKLGVTKPLALAQFRSLERKLEKNRDLKVTYQQFMDEYYRLNHMTSSHTNSIPDCYLPHHAVMKTESARGKFRAVFSGAAKSSTGVSLNDTLHAGPNLQQDLQSLILKWRQYQFVYTAEIEKMYRQIMMHHEDQVYQKILWRNTQKEPIQSYQLTTVTYGTKPAPFLAMMCLKQLAKDEKLNYPVAAKALEELFYMDDFCGGGHSLEESKQLRNELIVLLKSAGFNLRKWSANNPLLLEDLDKNMLNEQTYEFKQSDSTKTLGIGWNPHKDKFYFDYKLNSDLTEKPTKRVLLSDISKLFDPQGWYTPVSTTMKILFRNVWLSNLGWDDILPEKLINEWTNLRIDLQHIRNIEVNRWLGVRKYNQKLEIHGFCDSSCIAYACVIYCKVTNNDHTTVTLVAAKSRIAPLNKPISIPRLELMGAQLLSQLMQKVRECLSEYDNIDIYCWSDSTAVLGWIHGDPARWKPFVANRVNLITKATPSDCWRYVNTHENPADCASRGLSAIMLKNHTLWWQGPQWLPSYAKPSQDRTIYETSLEIKPAILKQSNALFNQNATTPIIEQLLNKYSSINKITRVLAWILRFLRYKKQLRQPYLTLHELRRAKLLIIKHVQRTSFARDLDCLHKYNKVHSKSNILNLNPIIDLDGILRVGGRIGKADINFEMKHPIILPHNHILTTLLIQEAHELTFHGGARLTLANLRQRYWIISGYMATKKYCRHCVVCKKHDPVRQYQLMGDLPAARINPEKAFFHCGLDMTGFIDVKGNRGRGIKTTKGYIALFICMVTKAVHIELVSDLSSSALLAALARMAARRGAPRHVYSDNGTNFVGANRMLQEEYDHLQQIFSASFLTEITELGIEWHFNAPSWPSAGGLWERNVRSLKHHLKRVVGHQKLTFEEYTTLLAKIEACLNSRPLCALTEDTDNLDFLTPSHFLSARPGLTVIETEQDARTRWHLINKLFQDLWKRWKAEYLTQLTARTKWTNRQDNIKIGDLVVIRDDNLPAGKWAMGRVVDTHPGDDGLVRVVTLKTKNGLMKRPIVKLSVLPVSQTDNQSTSEDMIHQISDEPKPEEKRRRPRKSTFATICTALLFFMMLFVAPSHGLHNIHELSSNQTLYFDPISKLQLIRDKWKLIVYYDMIPYWAGIDAYKKLTTYLDRMCITIDTQSPCHMILSQLRHDYQELEYYNELLLTQHFNVHDRQRRRRRGIINGVGFLASELFGTLDSRFAEQYTKDIETIRQNQKHLSKLWRNQTSVIESEFNLMKKMEDTVEKQHKFINKKLLSLEESTNVFQKEIQNMSYVQDFTLSAMAANSLLHCVRRLQDTLLDIITDIYQGQIRLHLLTPSQLKTELQTINSQLLSDLTLPIRDIDTEIQHIYQLLKVKARVTQKFIIFEVTFPLISRECFQLYKLFSVPHQMKNNMVSIIPVSEYVAVNFKQDAYFAVNSNDLNSCLHHGEAYMCQLLKPILTLENDKSFCAKSLQGNNCEVQTTTCTNRWVELHLTSQYLYFCCDIYSIKIICDDQVTMRQLRQAGIISITQSCIIKGKDFVLHSLQHGSNQLSISPDIYLPEIDQINHFVNIKIPVDMIPDSKDMNSSFRSLDKQIKNLKSSTDTLDGEMSSHDIHHYTISYILVAVVTCIAVVWLWKNGRCRLCPRTAARRRGDSPERHQRPVQPLPPPRLSGDQCTSSVPPPRPSSDQCTSSVPSIPSRKQSTVDPCQQSASELCERNYASVRFVKLADRWPSIRRGLNSNKSTLKHSEDNPVFTIEDTIV